MGTKNKYYKPCRKQKNTSNLFCLVWELGGLDACKRLPRGTPTISSPSRPNSNNSLTAVSAIGFFKSL